MTLLLTFVAGAVLGSFFNVCIHRLPREESIVRPRSSCPACRAPIAWYDNIPLLSFVVLGARCRHCRSPIAWRYPAVELLSGATAVAVVLRLGLKTDAAVYGTLLAALIVISVIDLEHQIIPDVLSVPGIAAGLVFATLSPQLSLRSALVGAALGGGTLLIVAVSYVALTGREGMGGGDVKLLAMIGAFLGWPAVPYTLFVGSLAGSAVSIGAMLAGKAGRHTPIPFGPFLAFGAATYIFGGHELTRAYLDWSYSLR